MDGVVVMARVFPLRVKWKKGGGGKLRRDDEGIFRLQSVFPGGVESNNQGKHPS